MRYNLNLNESVHRMIAAPTRSGKSYFIGACVEEMYRQKHSFIILDTKCRNHLGLAALRSVKLIQINSDYTYNWENINKYRYVLCVPTLKTRTEDLINIYRGLLDTLFMADGERIILLEECHNYNKSSNSPDPLLELIAREGAGRRKYLWFITQRLQNFPKLLWAQCGYTYIFRHNIPQDIKYLEAGIPNFTEINLKLQPHDVYVWNHGATQTAPENCIIKAKDVIRRTKHLG